MIRPLKAIGPAGCILCLFFLIVSCSALKTEKKLKREQEISENTIISPSFDCAKERSSLLPLLGKQVCSDPETANLYAEMTARYKIWHSKATDKKKR